MHRKSLRYHRKTYELGSQSTYLRLKSRILSLFKPYYIAVDFIQHIISLSNSLNQEVKLPLPLQIKSSRSEYRINSLFSRLIGFLGGDRGVGN